MRFRNGVRQDYPNLYPKGDPVEQEDEPRRFNHVDLDLKWGTYNAYYHLSHGRSWMIEQISRQDFRISLTMLSYMIDLKHQEERNNPQQ